ncbi:AbrB family transcriptional regulator [Oceanicola sp. S124]|uniref:AbrB family transcriptional regulator n=1 Tax=Oceanicola sp. S124 TaxID=1042378 RepID=UPI0002557AA7|nr:AbrB family transcriptional regulator [Oceanicola sp. S124]
MQDFPRTAFRLIALCLLGYLGGLAAHLIGLPLPYMLGSLFAVALTAGLLPGILPENYKFPEGFRSLFIAIIGTTIGAQITWEIVGNLPRMLPSILALTLFVPLTQAVNYQIFRRIGGYDRATAFYAGAPGGLIDSIVSGEAAGADVRILAVQQFLRIIVVVSLLPVGLSLWYGHPVGSSAGMSMSGGNVGLEHLPEVLGAAVLGLLIFRRLHIPASQLIGPLICSAVLTLSGLAVIEAPGWVVSGCQVIIGTSLGTRFIGVEWGRLLRATWLSALSVAVMLAIGLTLALSVAPLTGQHTDVLVISFAPGGVTEMALVALSLNTNPAVVTMHHLYRIVLTVLCLGFVSKRGWFDTPKAGA